MYNKLKLVEEFENSLANFFNEEYVNSDVQQIFDETEDIINEDSNNQLKKAIKTISSEIEDYYDEDFDGDGDDDIDPDELDDLFMGGDDEIVELADEEEIDDIEQKRLKESYDRDDQLIDYLLEDYSSDNYYLEDLDPDCESDFEMVNDLTDYSFDEEYDTIDSLLYSLDEDYLDEDCYDRNDIDYNVEDFDEFDDFDEECDLLTEGPIRVIKKPGCAVTGAIRGSIDGALDYGKRWGDALDRKIPLAVGKVIGTEVGGNVGSVIGLGKGAVKGWKGEDYKAKLNLCGRSFKLKVIFDKFSNERITDGQIRALKTLPKDITDCAGSVQAYCGMKSGNIFQYVMPKYVFVKRSKEPVVAVMCDYKKDRDNGIAIVFENGKLKEVTSQDNVL